MQHPFPYHIISALISDPRFRYQYKKQTMNQIKFLMKEYGFTYTELLNMDLGYFQELKKDYVEKTKDKNEFMKKILEKRGDKFWYTLDINQI